MKAYVISGVHVRDEEPLVALRKDSARIIHQYQGRYLTAGRPSEWVEGEVQPERIGIMEFPSLEDARAYVYSPEFQALTERRKQWADAFLVVVEGIDDAGDHGE